MSKRPNRTNRSFVVPASLSPDPDTAVGVRAVAAHRWAVRHRGTRTRRGGAIPRATPQTSAARVGRRRPRAHEKVRSRSGCTTSRRPRTRRQSSVSSGARYRSPVRLSVRLFGVFAARRGPESRGQRRVRSPVAAGAQLGAQRQRAPGLDELAVRATVLGPRHNMHSGASGAARHGLGSVQRVSDGRREAAQRRAGRANAHEGSAHGFIVAPSSHTVTRTG